jgi:hypothetical protein
MQDPDFFEYFKGGHKEALSAIFEEKRVGLFCKATAMLPNREDAEDLEPPEGLVSMKAPRSTSRRVISSPTVL